MQYRTIKFRRDDKDCCFLYFKNKAVEIHADEIKVLDYTNLNGCIWESEVIQHEFHKLEDSTESQFYRFCVFAMAGSNKEEIIKQELQVKRVLALSSSIGYNIHKFKDHNKAKCVMYIDNKLSKEKNPEGRSGKSLAYRAIQQVIPTSFIDARRLKNDEAPWRFALSNVKLDHKLVVFNDVGRFFDFDRLYNYITDEFTIEGKKTDSVIIPFHKSPKIGLTTNFTVPGEGSSYSDRQHIIEFTDFFNPKNRPGDLLNNGEQFFIGWQESQWNLFFNTIVDFVQLYLKEGLIKYEGGNYEKRRLLDTMGEEVILWFSEVPRRKEVPLKDLYNLFREQNGDYNNQKFTQNKFSGWLKKYCAFEKVYINPYHKDGRNRKDGTDYITLINHGELDESKLVNTIQLQEAE